MPNSFIKGDVPKGSGAADAPDPRQLAPTWRVANGLCLADTALGKTCSGSCLRTSDGLGWPNLHAALTEAPPGYAEYEPTPLLWIAIPLLKFDVFRIVGPRKERAVLRPSSISIVPRQTALAVRRLTFSRAFHVTLRPNLLTEVAGELFDMAPEPEILPALGQRDPYMASLLWAAMQALDEPAQFSSMKIEYLSRALAANVLAKHAVQTHGSLIIDNRSRLNMRQMRRVLNYIQENLPSDISLNELAAVAGVSRTVFIQRFKVSVNRTPHQYLMWARVTRGREFLVKSDLSISEIAHLCGFADHAHFTSVFKRIFGVTPSAYRRERE